MPNVREMYPPSKFLGSHDFPNPVVLTIQDVRPENFKPRGQQHAETRWVLYFRENPKGLKLNSTNISALEEGFGAESDLWLGKRVRVYNDPTVQFGGRKVGGVRLQLPRLTEAMGTQPVAGAPTPRFDPMTGAPLAPPVPAGARFDPMTGQPLHATVDASTGELAHFNSPPGKDAEFDDDIPF